jgi:hypothetical protein
MPGAVCFIRRWGNTLPSDMRAMFLTYVLFLLAGTSFFIVIGLTHH